MALYPDVQSRVQAELDTTVGRDNLPQASDLAHFSYLTAVLKEVLRYAPVANLGGLILSGLISPIDKFHSASSQSHRRGRI